MDTLKQRLIELRRQVILLGYQGCGYPTEEWFELSDAKLFTAIDLLNPPAIEQEIQQLEKQLAG